MLDKPLDDIDLTDLDELVQEKWPEGKTIDYKRDMYGGSDSEKKELLKDVSSFANTSGGDLVIGVDEKNSIPVGIPGVSLTNVDAEKLRLEEIIRRGIEPRIDFAVHSVSTSTGTTAFIIRVQESWIFPHRVVFGGKFGEFWARNSAGKYSMDTTELRRAFTLSETIFDKIRAFRRDRVAEVIAGNTPIVLREGGKMILHLVPVESFRSRITLDCSQYNSLTTQFPPLACGGWDRRINLDGHVNFGGGRPGEASRSYTQVFRNGIIEAVAGDVLEEIRDGERSAFHPKWCEKHLIAGVKAYLASYQEHRIRPPIGCFLTLIGVKGAIAVAEFGGDVYPIDRDVLSLPELIIADLSSEPTALLRPLFDLMWNAAGCQRSYSYDPDGHWRG
ncbi:MAG: ATP-binding protein [Thermoguttaceae bacterium]|jgi:hypothetical protein|nr:ATP-binding protein [Thermoguttaceae bacterium]